ncbi:MAG: Hsp20/alpha crystallin family protein [Euryarchaeota archaeon]|nr:Hsp20/alpha crystallin family protein [Euryarchaeota archaeon]
MAIMRYTPRRIFSPWPEFTGFANRLPRLFDEPWNTPEPTRSWFPAVNVEEEPDELILTAELPGLAEEDVHLEIENNILTIRGEKREEREEGDDKRRFHVWERRYGSFQRAFTLPKSVAVDGVRADFDNGILTVRMPKATEARSRTIEIKGGK